jgi:hypothetical protein
MRKLIALVLLALPLPAMADHYDVIEFKLTEACSFETYMGVVKDFNEWGKGHGYQAEVAVKLQHTDLNTMIWLGRSANAATFGKAWDTWRNAQSDPASTPAKLQARFAKCSTNVGRRSYDVY